jgi:hypothetical protein
VKIKISGGVNHYFSVNDKLYDMSAGKVDLYFMQCQNGKLTKILEMFVTKLPERIMKNNCVGS